MKKNLIIENLFENIEQFHNAQNNFNSLLNDFHKIDREAVFNKDNMLNTLKAEESKLNLFIKKIENVSFSTILSNEDINNNDFYPKKTLKHSNKIHEMDYSLRNSNNKYSTEENTNQAFIEVNNILENIYEKFQSKNQSLLPETDEPNELKKAEFVANLINKFYSDNKYLIELVTKLENEKNSPYIDRIIQNKDKIEDVYNHIVIIVC